MPYPQMVEYNEAVQNPAHAFLDPELKKGSVRENNLGLPMVLSGGFALTYTVTTPNRKCAVRCFHREVSHIEEKYTSIAQKLNALRSEYFVHFDFQKQGIIVKENRFPIVRMDWVEGDPLGVWLDKNYENPRVLQKARADFTSLASFLEREGIAHGDIQNGNVMLSRGSVKLIDYDGMYVPGMSLGSGSETGHKHFQHPHRRSSDYGPKMDRFSFIALDISLHATIENKDLYRRFREGGETIVFKANDFIDPQNSKIFKVLEANARLRDEAQRFAAICDADIASVPSLSDFHAGRNVPIRKSKTAIAPVVRALVYVSPYPVLDAGDFDAAERRVGDRVELVGEIVEVKVGTGQHGKGRGRPYIFINFGPWKGRIVKVTIWSEGLSNLKEQPSSEWIGRWISVNGLVDPPYSSKRYGYTHLSITVEREGQIQPLDEKEARFRLASIGKPAPQGGRATAGTTNGSSNVPITPPRPSPPQSAPKLPKSGNQDIVARFKKLAEPPPPSAPFPGPPQRGSTPVSTRPSPGIPKWIWWAAIGIIVLLYVLSR